VRPALRKKIKETADELGYRPDPGFAELAANRWRNRRTMRGLVLALILHRENAPSPQRGHVESLRKAVEARGYHLDLFDMAEYGDAAKLQRVLRNRGIRGLILPQIPTLEHDEVLQLDFEHFTVVSIGVGRLTLPFHTITANTFRNTRMVIEEAWRRGYRRIGLAPFSHSPLAREDGYRIGCSLFLRELLGEAHFIPLLVDQWREGGLMAWFKQHRPDVVISHTMRGYWHLLAHDIAIPDEVGYVSLKTDENEQGSGVRRNFDVMAQACVDFLLAQIRQNEWGIPAHRQFIQVDSEWVEGSTLPWRTSSPQPLPESLDRAWI